VDRSAEDPRVGVDDRSRPRLEPFDVEDGLTVHEDPVGNLFEVARFAHRAHVERRLRRVVGWWEITREV
jgi:hypothetical protein